MPLEEEFHWSRATIALAVSINLILYGCIGLFAAAVMERFGIRLTVLCAPTWWASASSHFADARTLATHPDVGRSGRLGHRLSRNRVCDHRDALVHGAAAQSLVIGILSGGASTGQLLFLPVMANITAAYGWRTMVLCIAAVVCVVLPLVALILRTGHRIWA